MNDQYGKWSEQILKIEMQQFKIVVYAFVILMLSNCSTSLTEKRTDSSSFSYNLKGKVINGDGLNVELDFPQSVEEGLVSRIENGEFTFNGSSERMQLGQIRIQGSRGYGKVLIEPGKSIIDYEVLGDSINPYLSIIKIRKGRNGKLLYDFYQKVDEAIASRAWVFGDPIMMDSMRRLVYPKIREQVFPIYDKYFDVFHPEVQLIIMNSMAERLEGPGYLDKKDLDSNEVEKIRTYFSKIDTSLSMHWAYRNAKTSIELIEENEIKVKFHAYKLFDLEEATRSLDQIVRKNKYTILDFWWSGCGPCRKFNVEMKSAYRELQKDEVEIVGINIDKIRSRWEKASSMDEIEWPNYFGGHTDIALKYQVNKFPTYILVDRDHQIVKILESKEEILNWFVSRD